MRSNRLWIGVTCGVALAFGGVAAVVAGTQTAGAHPICKTMAGSARWAPAWAPGGAIIITRSGRLHHGRPEPKRPADDAGQTVRD